MANKTLLTKVNQLGLSLFESEKDVDSLQTLADVVKSGELRLLEGFPVLLTNAAKKGVFDYAQAAKALPTAVLKRLLKGLFLMSLALYRHKRLTFSWADDLTKDLSKSDAKMLKTFLTAFRSN